MNFGAHLKIEGANCLQWIKENEEGLIELYFDTEEGEVSLQLEPICFETLAHVINEFVEHGKIARNTRASKGRVRPDRVDLERCPALPTRNRFPTHIEIGRGCHWGCAYCQTPGIHGRTERFRSLDSIEKVVDFYARTGMEDYRFVLPNALGYASERPGEPNCDALSALLEESLGSSGGSAGGSAGRSPATG